MIISRALYVQSKELKIPQFGNDSLTHLPIAIYLNTSNFTESIYQHISKNKNEVVVHDIYARKNEKLEVPLFQYVKVTSLNETAIAEINNNKTASKTRYHLNSISSSENGERNRRISVTSAALRIAARHALDATHNLYDKIEPNIIQRGIHQNITF